MSTSQSLLRNLRQADRHLDSILARTPPQSAIPIYTERKSRQVAVIEGQFRVVKTCLS